jgi:hypothetical protein
VGAASTLTGAGIVALSGPQWPSGGLDLCSLYVLMPAADRCLVRSTFKQ